MCLVPHTFTLRSYTHTTSGWANLTCYSPWLSDSEPPNFKAHADTHVPSSLHVWWTCHCICWWNESLTSSKRRAHPVLKHQHFNQVLISLCVCGKKCLSWALHMWLSVCKWGVIHSKCMCNKVEITKFQDTSLSLNSHTSCEMMKHIVQTHTQRDARGGFKIITTRKKHCYKTTQFIRQII